MTGTLADTEPTTSVLAVGPVKVAPGVTVREIGYDDNVFDEAESESPKHDFVATATPDVWFYSRLRFVRFSAYAGSELTYYHEYESERSVGYAGRARVDVLLSRIRPFFGAGHTNTRTRPNGEVDVRANRLEEELSGGLAFDLSTNSVVYASTATSSSRYEDALQDGIDLSQTLTRDATSYQGGLKTDLTPLLSVQVYGSYQEDDFPNEPTRNAKGSAANASFRFAPEAVVAGIVTVSYRDIEYADPGVKPFRGVVGSAAMTYPVLEIGRLTGAYLRGVEYSFDTVDAYYVENSGMLSYTQRLFGEVDLQGKLARSVFDYSARKTEPPHKDSLDTAAGSLGYNLRNRTRIAVNYEYARRRSPTFAARNYQRRRIFLSWLFAL
ncbi:MAG: outer membrane beta-barrel protein [Vicinamibacterales bacterium]